MHILSHPRCLCLVFEPRFKIEARNYRFLGSAAGFDLCCVAVVLLRVRFFISIFKRWKLWKYRQPPAPAGALSVINRY